MKIIRKIIQEFFRGIWNTSERTGIGLGRFAPYVFGMMVGAKTMKKIK